MKFKTLFILFNILLIVSFVCILFMPFFMLGWNYVKVFWAENWYLALVFCVVIAALNIYFLRNYKLFSLLEAEDWPRVRLYLEERVYIKKKMPRQSLRLLINTYIVLAAPQALAKLARYLEENSPKYFGIFALDLGIAVLAENDAEAARAYFERALAHPAARKKDWLRWNAARAGLVCPERETREAAAATLAELTGRRAPVLRLLSAYILDSRAEKNADEAKLTGKVRADLRASYTRASWKKTAGRFQASLTGLVLKQILDGAEAWLFKEKNT